MSETAILAENLSKQYSVASRPDGYRVLRDRLAGAVAKPFRAMRRLAGRNGHEVSANGRRPFWALQDVSFEIRRGDVVGLIGHNGAGKSTLLKLLSRITHPTRGLARIYGRVGSLLEVGSGFHAELTGRENVFLNGAILGMRRSEIIRKFDAIASFAEVESFIDTPVKHYSSGMYLRLAFAVAAHLQPEILLIDEVLAVGDAAFQKKCLGKMGEVAQDGRTVLFVSHNLTAVASLCTSAMRLDHGRLVAFGESSKVISDYLVADGDSLNFDRTRYPEDEDFRLDQVYVSQDGTRGGPFVTNRPVDVCIQYTIKRPVIGLRIGFDLLTVDGLTLWRTFDDDRDRPHVRQPGTYQAICRMPQDLFFPRQYIVSLAISIHGERWITFDQVRQVVEFYNVNGVGSAYADESWRNHCLLMLGPEWSSARV